VVTEIIKTPIILGRGFCENEYVKIEVGKKDGNNKNWKRQS